MNKLRVLPQLRRKHPPKTRVWVLSPPGDAAASVCVASTQSNANSRGWIIATAFAQEDAVAASQQWRKVADQLRPKLPKLAALIDDAEQDVLAYMTFPAARRSKLHSTNPIECLNGEIKRRTEVLFDRSRFREKTGLVLLS